jgi:hypothetical protein
LIQKIGDFEREREREGAYLEILATFSSEFIGRSWNYFHFHSELGFQFYSSSINGRDGEMSGSAGLLEREKP